MSRFCSVCGLRVGRGIFSGWHHLDGKKHGHKPVVRQEGDLETTSTLGAWTVVPGADWEDDTPFKNAPFHVTNYASDDSVQPEIIQPQQPEISAESPEPSPPPDPPTDSGFDSAGTDNSNLT